MSKSDVSGWVLCCAKQVSEDDPFWVGWVPVMKVEGSVIHFRPPVFNSLTIPKPHDWIDKEKGTHYKLLPYTLVYGAEKPRDIELAKYAGWAGTGPDALPAG